MFKSDLNKNENVLTVSFEGRMDGLKVKEIEAGLQLEMAGFSESNPNLKVTFDLAKVDYIASSFIRICVAAAKGFPEGNFSITNTDPLVKKTFKIAGLENVLRVS